MQWYYTGIYLKKIKTTSIKCLYSVEVTMNILYLFYSESNFPIRASV